MANLALLQLVLQHFLQARVASISLLHCWPLSSQNEVEFAGMAPANGLYVQFINIAAAAAMQQFAASIQRQDRHPVVGMFLDWHCDGNLAIVNMSSDIQLFSNHYNWLIYDGLGETSKFRQHFEAVNLTVDTQLRYAARLQPAAGNGSAYRLYDVYNNGRQFGGKLNMTADRELVCHAEGCGRRQYLSALHLRTKYGNRQQLRDVTLRAAVIVVGRPLNLPHTEQIVFLSSEEYSPLNMVTRLSYQLMVITGEMLQCNFQLIYTNSWGHTETAGGCIGALINRSVEYCSSPFIITEKRLAHTRPMLEMSSYLPICMFRTPRDSGMQWSVFLAPFSRLVWHVFGVLLLLATLLLWHTFRVEQRLQPRDRWDFVPSLVATALLAFGTACFQGSHLVPRSFGGRIAFFALSLICFIVYNYYTSAVVSSLLGAPVKSDIKSLAQLADSVLPVSVEPTAYNMLFFNVSPLPEVRRFVRRKIDPQPHSAWKSLDEGLLLVRDRPGYVFVFEGITGYRRVQELYRPEEICDLNQFVYRPQRGLFSHLHRNSSFKEIMMLRQLRAIETGVFLKLRRFYANGKLHCFADSIFVDVGMGFLAPLFIMLAGAYVVTLLVLLLEIGYKNLQRHRLPGIEAD